MENQIKKLAGQMPIANQKAQTGLMEAAKTRTQTALGGVPPMGQPLGVRQVQAQAGQQAGQQGQAILGGVQQNAQQGQQIQQAAAQSDVDKSQSALRDRQLRLSAAQRQMERQLSSTDSRLKSRLLDDQMVFHRDELGRTLFNDRQLLDYKIANAKSEIELADFEQNMREESTKRIQVLSMAQAQISQALEQSATEGQQALDAQQRIRLAEAKRKLEEKIRKEKARAANRASMFSAAGAIAGAVAGNMIAPGVGAAVGASVGSGLGSVAGSLVN